MTSNGERVYTAAQIAAALDELEGSGCLLCVDWVTDKMAMCKSCKNYSNFRLWKEGEE